MNGGRVSMQSVRQGRQKRACTEARPNIDHPRKQSEHVGREEEGGGGGGGGGGSERRPAALGGHARADALCQRRLLVHLLAPSPALSPARPAARTQRAESTHPPVFEQELQHGGDLSQHDPRG
eukprot:2850280-Rhodomonas_salina.2